MGWGRGGFVGTTQLVLGGVFVGGADVDGFEGGGALGFLLDAIEIGGWPGVLVELLEWIAHEWRHRDDLFTALKLSSDALSLIVQCQGNTARTTVCFDGLMRCDGRWT